jgi:hypothetical protein
MTSAEQDPYLQARRELARREGSPRAPSSRNDQARVIDLMRRRARDPSLAAVYGRLQELGRENERLRRRTPA